jgi:hypothetical protein
LDGRPILQATVRDVTAEKWATESLRIAKAEKEAANAPR